MASERQPPITLLMHKTRTGAILPQRATEQASGYDLYACLDEIGPVDVTRDPTLIPTGIAMALPDGFDAQVRPRSGLTMQGLMVALGTIDADYRGELFVTMFVYGSRESFRVSHGDRIAQLVISRLADVQIVEAGELPPTTRGAGGHGSTGLR